MSLGRELYAILGVAETATSDEIKRAYRRRAKDCHPDRGGDPDDFDRLQRAFQTLHDPDRRRRYDADGSYDDVQTERERPQDTIILSILHQIIENVVCGDQQPDLTQIDVVEVILANLRGMEQKIEASIDVTLSRMERNRELTRRLRKRRRRADSPDMLRMVLRGQRTELGRVVEKQRADLTIHRRVIRVFEGYGYDWVRLLEGTWAVGPGFSTGGTSPFFR